MEYVALSPEQAELERLLEMPRRSPFITARNGCLAFRTFSPEETQAHIDDYKEAYQDEIEAYQEEYGELD